MKNSSLGDNCVIIELLLSYDSLIYGCSNCDGRKRRGGFSFDLGMDRLKGRLKKLRWARFGVCKFVGGFDIRVTKL